MKVIGVILMKWYWIILVNIVKGRAHNACFQIWEKIASQKSKVERNPLWIAKKFSEFDPKDGDRSIVRCALRKAFTNTQARGNLLRIFAGKLK